MDYEISYIDEIDKSLFNQFKAAFPSSEWQLEHTQQFIADDHNHLLLAKTGDEVCGFVYYYILDRLDHRQKEILIYEIEVAEKCRQQGVGTSLVERIKEHAAENQISQIWVLTNESNTAAQKLYLKAGASIPNAEDKDVMFLFKV